MLRAHKYILFLDSGRSLDVHSSLGALYNSIYYISDLQTEQFQINLSDGEIETGSHIKLSEADDMILYEV